MRFLTITKIWYANKLLHPNNEIEITKTNSKQTGIIIFIWTTTVMLVSDAFFLIRFAIALVCFHTFISMYIKSTSFSTENWITEQLEQTTVLKIETLSHQIKLSVKSAEVLKWTFWYFQILEITIWTIIKNKEKFFPVKKTLTLTKFKYFNILSATFASDWATPKSYDLQ